MKTPDRRPVPIEAGKHQIVAWKAPLPQVIYPVMHPALGITKIFPVPVGPMHGGNGYQAIFK